MGNAQRLPRGTTPEHEPATTQTELLSFAEIHPATQVPSQGGKRARTPCQHCAEGWLSTLNLHSDPIEVGDTILPILQMEKLKQRR